MQRDQAAATDVAGSRQHISGIACLVWSTTPFQGQKLLSLVVCSTAYEFNPLSEVVRAVDSLWY